MKNPGLPPDEFICDTVIDRVLLFDGCGRVTSAAQIRKVFKCPMRDFSSFNQISLIVTNPMETVLYVEIKLFHGSGKTDMNKQPRCKHRGIVDENPLEISPQGAGNLPEAIDKPVSMTGGRECIPAGKTIELRFPEESFGTYGKPDRWRDISSIEIIIKREKTDDSVEPVKADIGTVYGCHRVIPKGPRLTDAGIAAMLGCFKTANVMCPAAEDIDPYKPEYGSLLSMPPYHPYPKECADEILSGRIMGENLSLPISWDANPSGVLEWSHFFHRHHFLKEVMAGFLKTKDPRFIVFLDEAVRGWIISHPVPVESNGGAGPSWETLSAAWRFKEWLWIRGIAWSCNAFREGTKTLMLRSLWEHCRHLMAHKGHPNNWIIIESSALAIAGMCLTEFREAGEWFGEGIKRLESEFYRQFMTDGVHYELSPFYHAICLHALLEVKRAASIKHMSLPAIFDTPLEMAAGYLAALCRPDFTWPSINDSGGIAGDYSAVMELAGKLFDRPDFMWIGTKGREGTPVALKTAQIFPDGGIGIMRSSYEKDAHYLLFRAGPAGMTHVHEDALSIDVAVYGTPCLVDAGITAYTPGPLTDYYRSAAAHNMILIDGDGPVRSQSGFSDRVRPARKRFGVCHRTSGTDSMMFDLLSDISTEKYPISPDMLLASVSDCPEQTVVRQGSSVFCVSKSSEVERERMKPPERNERVCEGQSDTDACPDGKYEIDTLSGVCDDYFDETGEKITVTRMIAFPACACWIIRDFIEGSGVHTITVCWQFAPGEVMIDPDSHIVSFRNSKGRGLDLVPASMGLKFDLIHSKGNAGLSPFGWVSVNGKDIAADHLRFCFSCSLPVTLSWLLYPAL